MGLAIPTAIALCCCVVPCTCLRDSLLFVSKLLMMIVDAGLVCKICFIVLLIFVIRKKVSYFVANTLKLFTLHHTETISSMKFMMDELLISLMVHINLKSYDFSLPKQCECIQHLHVHCIQLHKPSAEIETKRKCISMRSFFTISASTKGIKPSRGSVFSGSITFVLPPRKSSGASVYVGFVYNRIMLCFQKIRYFFATQPVHHAASIFKFNDVFPLVLFCTHKCNGADSDAGNRFFWH